MQAPSAQDFARAPLQVQLCALLKMYFFSCAAFLSLIVQPPKFSVSFQNFPQAAICMKIIRNFSSGQLHMITAAWIWEVRQNMTNGRSCCHVQGLYWMGACRLRKVLKGYGKFWWLHTRIASVKNRMSTSPSQPVNQKWQPCHIFQYLFSFLLLGKDRRFPIYVKFYHSLPQYKHLLLNILLRKKNNRFTKVNLLFFKCNEI